MLQDLNQDELNELADLLLLSQKAKAREALCIKIGISFYKELGFIYESSDSSFAINLINHLNEVGNTKAICQLCCKELSPIFQGSRESFLKGIAAKLNCNRDFEQNHSKYKILEQPTSPAPIPSNQLDESKPESWFTKIGNLNKKLLTSGAILLVGLAGFAIHGQINQTVVDPKYSPLKELLEVRKWQDADEETASIMRGIIGKNKFNPLYVEDIEKIPCTDLNTIDKLWLKYSNKTFGFSIQKQIWRNIGGIEQGPQIESGSSGDVVFNTFLKQVGWSEKISKQNPPKGYFPVTTYWWQGYQPGWLEALFSRIDACKADK